MENQMNEQVKRLQHLAGIITESEAVGNGIVTTPAVGSLKEESKECGDKVVEEAEALGRKQMEDEMFKKIMVIAHEYNDKGLSRLLVAGNLEDVAHDVKTNGQFE